jgi:hypothetical protein
MSQPAFDFRAPVANVRTTTPDGTPAPPVNGRTTGARQASQSGAGAIRPTFSVRQRAYLQLLRQAGPLTDQAAAAVLGWQLCSVNSCRGTLEARIVEAGSESHTFIDAGGVARTTHRTRWTLNPHS